MDLNVLNKPKHKCSLSQVTPTPHDLSLKLQRCMLQLKGGHMTEDGHGVDYNQLKESKLFKEYTELAQQLVNCDPTTLEDLQRKAFFINVYNSLTIHGLASANQLPTSVLEVEQFWRRTAYDIGGLIYSLDDIEHGVLRGNKPHPSASTPQFGENDPRLKVALKTCDPRIHFALVCGAKSCPAIQVYSGRNIEVALTRAAEGFCTQEVEVENGSVTLSKIFHWYGSDFGTSERELLQWVCQFLPAGTREQLEKLLATHKNIEIKNKDYNWQLNKL